MRVLITGITGMAGSFLAEYVAEHHPQVEVFGTFRWRSKLDNLQTLRNSGKLNVLDEGQRITDEAGLRHFVRPGHVTVIDCELQDPSAVRHVIRAVRPDRIFHLAAQSFVPTSWHAPAATLQNNVVSQVNLLEAVRETRLDPVIHIAGSSEEYGLVHPDEAPIKETNPLRPLSPYAVSKVTQEMLAIQYHRSYKLKTIVTRGFNHTGPRRGQVFATSSFAKQIAEIEAGLRPPVIEVGDLDSRRDWTDTRDTVRAYWLATEHGTPGEVYNVGRGTCIRV
ncbi:MAG: GDP-mannose 4,6-dehydratase, partial [Chloroflexi bacterium]|nr:GDP-mannose 4,6-dehydratase [Chloroflexota bacterium]